MTLLFTDRTFDVFQQEDLSDFMDQNRKYIQPVLRKYGQIIREKLEDQAQFKDLPLHVAKHLRRRVKPPFNTWVSIGGDGRGYKKYCHLQLGINSDYVFCIIALIDHPPQEQEIIKAWQENSQLISDLDQDYVFIFDHRKLPYQPLKEMPLEEIFSRPLKSKKQDILIGKVLAKGHPILQDSVLFETWLLELVEDLRPLYQLAYRIDHRNNKE